MLTFLEILIILIFYLFQERLDFLFSLVAAFPMIETDILFNCSLLVLSRSPHVIGRYS